MKVIYLSCPQCRGDFYIDTEFLTNKEAYCHCPFCAREFKPEESAKPLVS